MKSFLLAVAIIAACSAGALYIADAHVVCQHGLDCRLLFPASHAAGHGLHIHSGEYQ